MACNGQGHQKASKIFEADKITIDFLNVDHPNVLRQLLIEDMQDSGGLLHKLAVLSEDNAPLLAMISDQFSQLKTDYYALTVKRTQNETRKKCIKSSVSKQRVLKKKKTR